MDVVVEPHRERLTWDGYLSLELVFTNHSFKSTTLRAPLGVTDNGNTRLLGSHLPIGYWRKSDDDIPSMSECGVCRLVLKEKK